MGARIVWEVASWFRSEQNGESYECCAVKLFTPVKDNSWY